MPANGLPPGVSGVSSGPIPRRGLDAQELSTLGSHLAEGRRRRASAAHRRTSQSGSLEAWSTASRACGDPICVKTARRNHGIDGCVRSLVDEDVLTLQGAARYTKTSDTTIRKLVDGGVLPMHQVVPFAPWEIRRTDVDNERVRAVLARLKHTGRLVLGDTSDTQPELFQ